MNALQQFIKKMETYPNITPGIAHLFKLRILEILSKEQEKELDEWCDASESNDRLFDMVLSFGHTKIGKSFTTEQRIKEVVAYANITPRVIELQDKFFLNIATIDENNEIAEWMHESDANDRLFDLLLDHIIENTKAETIPMLKKLVEVA